MADAATFVYADWAAAFPEFDAVPQGVITGYFAQAGMFWRNDGTSPAPTTALQTQYMYLLTAHIATLRSQSQGGANPGAATDANNPVGRVSSATEGSVTAQFELNMNMTSSEYEAWLQQTQYGLMFLAATSGYGLGHVAPGYLQPGGLAGVGGPYPLGGVLGGGYNYRGRRW